MEMVKFSFPIENDTGDVLYEHTLLLCIKGVFKKQFFEYGVQI